MVTRKRKLDLPGDIKNSTKELTRTLWKEFPGFHNVLSLEGSRQRIRNNVQQYILATAGDLNYHFPSLHPLEIHNARNCFRVLSNVFSYENEQMSGYSALEYLIRLANEGKKVHDEIEAGFIVEFLHLLRGAAGESGIYETDRPWSFPRMEGRKAARLRSKALDRMSDDAQSYIKRYTSGLDPEVVEQRKGKARKMAKAMGAGMDDWNNWKWQVGHVIKTSDEVERFVRISDEDRQAIDEAVANKVPFGITPHYLSLMDTEPSDRDRAVRAQVIPDLEFVRKTVEFRGASPQELDFMRERDTAPQNLITRRYPMIAILKPVNTCPQICVYCQRNWEIFEAMSPQGWAKKEELESSLDWIEKTKSLTEVLITGGDPALLSNNRLRKLLGRLAGFDHIERIRIGTRMPVTVPQRIDDSFADLLASFHVPGRREIVVVTHFEHLFEITPESVEAVQKIRKRGVSVVNQIVYTYFNSRRFEAVATRMALRKAGVLPYYTFSTQGKEETSRYRVPISRLLQENAEESRMVPGVLRIDKPVFNMPGIGKNYLDGWQNHEIIMIRPDGGRTWMFLPWEKNIHLADMFVYHDVPILDYIRKLAQDEEDINDYRTIWYYF